MGHPVQCKLNCIFKFHPKKETAWLERISSLITLEYMIMEVIHDVIIQIVLTIYFSSSILYCSETSFSSIGCGFRQLEATF